jgi:hypothetical protein
MTTPATRLAKKLDNLGDDCENWNYHDEADLYRTLADQLRAGKFTRLELGGEFIDGEKVIKALLARSHCG